MRTKQIDVDEETLTAVRSMIEDNPGRSGLDLVSLWKQDTGRSGLDVSEALGVLEEAGSIVYTVDHENFGHKELGWKVNT